VSDPDLTIDATRPTGTATPTPGPSRFAPGSIIAGRYRLVALLGRGGMGEVYRADDLTLDQPVALKFLPEGWAPTPTSSPSFTTSCGKDCLLVLPSNFYLLTFAVGGALHGSSGHGCFGYLPRNSLLTSGYVRSQKLRRSRVT